MLSSDFWTSKKAFSPDVLGLKKAVLSSVGSLDSFVVTFKFNCGFETLPLRV